MTAQPSDDPAVEALRNRQVKNLFTLLLTSVGAPLILMGDEVRHTHQGNNNVYCQDNEVSWVDWTLLEKHGDVRRFVKELIAGRLAFGQGRSDADILNELLRRVDFRFYDVDQFFFMINAYWEPLTFRLPLRDPGKNGWRVWIDTSQPSPHDIHSWSDAPPVPETTYVVTPRSIVVLAAD